MAESLVPWMASPAGSELQDSNPDWSPLSEAINTRSRVASFARRQIMAGSTTTLPSQAGSPGSGSPSQPSHNTVGALPSTVTISGALNSTSNQQRGRQQHQRQHVSSSPAVLSSVPSSRHPSTNPAYSTTSTEVSGISVSQLSHTARGPAATSSSPAANTSPQQHHQQQQHHQHNSSSAYSSKHASLTHFPPLGMSMNRTNSMRGVGGGGGGGSHQQTGLNSLAASAIAMHNPNVAAALAHAIGKSAAQAIAQGMSSGGMSPRQGALAAYHQHQQQQQQQQHRSRGSSHPRDHHGHHHQHHHGQQSNHAPNISPTLQPSSGAGRRQQLESFLSEFLRHDELTQVLPPHSSGTLDIYDVIENSAGVIVDGLVTDKLLSQSAGNSPDRAGKAIAATANAASHALKTSSFDDSLALQQSRSQMSDNARDSLSASPSNAGSANNAGSVSGAGAGGGPLFTPTEVKGLLNRVLGAIFAPPQSLTRNYSTASHASAGDFTAQRSATMRSNNSSGEHDGPSQQQQQSSPHQQQQQHLQTTSPSVVQHQQSSSSCYSSSAPRFPQQHTSRPQQQQQQPTSTTSNNNNSFAGAGADVVSVYSPDVASLLGFNPQMRESNISNMGNQHHQHSSVSFLHSELHQSSFSQHHHQQSQIQSHSSFTSVAASPMPYSLIPAGSFRKRKISFRHTTRASISEAVDTGVGDTVKQVNQYMLMMVLGEGTQGTVYLALDIDTQDVRAIKEINKPNGNCTSLRSRVESRRLKRRLKQEIEIMRRARHPNLVTLYEVIDDPDATAVYLVMQHVMGGAILSLDITGQASQVYSVKRAVRFAAQLSSALEYLHHRRIVHQDLKPENILIDDNDIVRLADFGVSRCFVDPNSAGGGVGGGRVVASGSGGGAVHHNSSTASAVVAPGVSLPGSPSQLALGETYGSIAAASMRMPDRAAGGTVIFRAPEVLTTVTASPDRSPSSPPLKVQASSGGSGGGGSGAATPSVTVFSPPAPNLEASGQFIRNNNKKNAGKLSDAELEKLKKNDIWALGLSLYCVMYGKLPWDLSQMGTGEILDDICNMKKSIELPVRSPVDNAVVAMSVRVALGRMLDKCAATRCTAHQANELWRAVVEEFEQEEIDRINRDAEFADAGKILTSSGRSDDRNFLYDNNNDAGKNNNTGNGNWKQSGDKKNNNNNDDDDDDEEESDDETEDARSRPLFKQVRGAAGGLGSGLQRDSLTDSRNIHGSGNALASTSLTSSSGPNTGSNRSGSLSAHQQSLSQHSSAHNNAIGLPREDKKSSPLSFRPTGAFDMSGSLASIQEPQFHSHQQHQQQQHHHHTAQQQHQQQQYPPSNGGSGDITSGSASGSVSPGGSVFLPPPASMLNRRRGTVQPSAAGVSPIEPPVDVKEDYSGPNDNDDILGSGAKTPPREHLSIGKQHQQQQHHHQHSPPPVSKQQQQQASQHQQHDDGRRDSTATEDSPSKSFDDQIRLLEQLQQQVQTYAAPPPQPVSTSPQDAQIQQRVASIPSMGNSITSSFRRLSQTATPGTTTHDTLKQAMASTDIPWHPSSDTLDRNINSNNNSSGQSDAISVFASQAPQIITGVNSARSSSGEDESSRDGSRNGVRNQQRNGNNSGTYDSENGGSQIRMKVDSSMLLRPEGSDTTPHSASGSGWGSGRSTQAPVSPKSPHPPRDGSSMAEANPSPRGGNGAAGGGGLGRPPSLRLSSVGWKAPEELEQM